MAAEPIESDAAIKESLQLVFRARLSLDSLATQLSGSLRTSLTSAASSLASAGTPAAAALATAVEGEVTRAPLWLVSRVEDTGRAVDATAHDLMDQLSRRSGSGALPPLPARTSAMSALGVVDSVAARFPAGFAQDTAREAIADIAAAADPAGGPGGDWEVQNEVPGTAVKQITDGSCVSAAGEMLTWGQHSQEAIHARLGDWSDSGSLARHLNEEGDGQWIGGYIGHQFDKIVELKRLWLAEMFPKGGGGNKAHHAVVVVGVEDGVVTIRDPWEGSSYTMSLADFQYRWTGVGVVRVD